MKRRTIRILLFSILGLILIFGGYYGLQYAYIGSSYASKITCSCHFVSGRTLEDIKEHDLYAVPFSRISIDENSKVVTSSVYGLAKTKAIYREGFGCTLVNEISEQELRAQKNNYKRKTKSHQFAKTQTTAVFDSAKFYSLIEKAFADSSNKLQTRAFVILKDGKLVYERYAEGFTGNTPLGGWSMTKSVTNAMVGILIKDGVLDLLKSIPVLEWNEDARKNITLNDMLHMSSGLAFEENYAKPSDATKMLFRSYSTGQFSIKSKLEHQPGEQFSYSSGTSNILQEIIKRQFNDIHLYHAFPYERLFDKIGMSSAVIEPDASGTFVGSSFMYATALDWARFGQLFLQQGNWDGEQILPKGWTQYSATETPDSEGKYAAHFWVNHNMKDYPQDGYFASGFEGQYINILPSQNLVVVRLGCSHGGVKFDNAKFVADLIPLLKK